LSLTQWGPAVNVYRGFRPQISGKEAAIMSSMLSATLPGELR
jgi:hypothetical protein